MRLANLHRVAVTMSWLVLMFTPVPALAMDGNATPSGPEWVEWKYQWEKLTIIVRTDAGVFSPTLQGLGMGSTAGPPSTRPKQLIQQARTYFVMTSAPRVDHTFEFVEPLAQKWGPGHALPVIAAVALENVQRPMPSIFGGPIAAPRVNGPATDPRGASGIDPKKPGELVIVVNGSKLGFQHAAARSAHASSNAYYDAANNEVGLLLDMEMFKTYYAATDKMPGRYPATLSAFIAYVSDAFNQDSGHEMAHFAQRQANLATYKLPAIREGEAEVQGMTRRRDGLMFDFEYNTPEAWFTGHFDGELLKNRIETSERIGRPMSPMEVDRLVAITQREHAGRPLRSGDLLAMDESTFFSGSVSDIDDRYAQAWSLCLMAIRDKPSAELLTNAINARLAHKPRLDLEAEIDKRWSRFVADPNGMRVTEQKIWGDAEKYFQIDPVFVGEFYAWAYVANPANGKALVYLGDALYQGGNLHGAMRYYLYAQRHDEKSALPLLRVGDVQSKIGHRAEALDTWRQAAATAKDGQEEASYRDLARSRPLSFK